MKITIARLLIGGLIPMLGMTACAVETGENTGGSDMASSDDSLAVTSADAPSGYTLCAQESQRCAFSGSRVVAYGANGKFVYVTKVDGADCTNAVFGDPIQGVSKGCFTKNDGAPAGYAYCSPEFQRCSFSGTRSVAYGANGKFAFLDKTNGVDCNNDVFGDPIQGVSKGCYTKASTGGGGGFTPKGASCKLVLNEGFDNHPGALTKYPVSSLQQEWSNTSGWKGLDEGRAKVGNSSIQAFFPKDKILGQETGFTWFSDLSGSVTEAIMEYRIKFDAGFDWSRGGKLPGLCGGNCPRGCTEDSSQGFTMRLMWRENGRMITYPYWPDRPSATNCGGEWKWSKGVVANTWQTVRQEIKLNTPGQNNGTIKMYLDGQLVQQENSVKFRTSNSVTISKAYITTYVGGSTQDWAPDHDQHIEFDSFKVWTGCSE